MYVYVLAVKNCQALQAPQNGASSNNGTTPGSITTVTCAKNYEVSSGDRVRTCQTDGTWSGKSAVCTGM